MSNRLRFRVPAFFLLGGVLLFAAPSVAATWQSGVNYGGTTVMDLYVPTTVDASPGIVVALHYCTGNSSNAHSWFQALSDQYGFIIIAPSAGGSCFDAIPARSGERDAITKMVTYVVTQKHADTTRVFAAGASSGACMTYALLAAYPDVFAAGSSLAAVPAGAWTGGNAYGWTTPAGTTAQQWGDKVRNADPGFTGTRPRVQLWHGMQDTTLTYSQNFPAEVAQWTNVLGVSDANATASTFQGSQDTWTRKSYNASGKEVLETNTAPNAPHDLTGRGLWTDVVRFFGLDKDSPTGGGGTGGGGPTAGSGGAAGGGGRANGGAGGVANAGGGGTMSGTAGIGSDTGGRSAGGTAGATGAAGSTNATGGSTASGGASSTSGGNNAGGARSGASGSAATGAGSSDSSGCSCNTAGAGQPARGALVALLVAGLGALVRRRQRSAA